MYQLRTVVLEDDDVERLALIAKLKTFPLLEVVGDAASADEAYWLLVHTRPAVVFADIKLIGNDVFSVFRRLQKEGIPVPPTVIITAFPDYAEQTLNEYRQQVVKFLRKPFEEHWQQQLRSAIDALVAAQPQYLPPAAAVEAHFYKNFPQLIAALTAGREVENKTADVEQPADDHIYIEDRGMYYRIDFEKIIYIEIPNKRLTNKKKLTHIIQDIPSYEQHPTGGEAIYKPVTEYRVQWTLASLLKKLPPNRFQHIRRNFIVNLARIRRIYREQEAWRIEMLVGTKIVWRPIEQSCHHTLMANLHLAKNRKTDASADPANQALPLLYSPSLPKDRIADLPRVVIKIDWATIMICQIHDASGLAEQGEAVDFVEEVALCFQRFDEIVAQHRLELIDVRLGHRYVCAGGFAKSDHNHSHRVVRAAIEMQQFLQQQQAERKKKHLPWFELCIGIHAGPVVAAQAEPFYQLWGSTLNEATRIEHLSTPGKITLSAQAHRHVQYDFGFQCIKKVDTKSGTEVNVYQVLG